MLADTYWGRARNNHTDLLSLLVANTVTGAASLFRRELLEYALPFPPAQFAHYHDHWLGLTALSLGGIRFVDRPLYDYMQHAGASLGHEAATTMTSLAQRSPGQRSPRERARMWRLHYFVDVCRLLEFATVLRMRCGEQMPRAKRRALDRFLAPTARRRRWRGSAPAAYASCRGAGATRSGPSGCCSGRSPGAGCSPPARATGPSTACAWTRCRRRRW